MIKRNAVDLVGGALVILAGLFVFAYALANYRLGTAHNMGPGFFPVSLGLVTVIVGAIIIATALRRAGTWPEIAWRPAFWVFASVAGFIVGMRFLGLLPAILMTVVLSSMADSDSRPLGTLVLAVVVSAGCWLVFSRGLGMTMPLLRIPF